MGPYEALGQSLETKAWQKAEAELAEIKAPEQDDKIADRLG